MKMKIKDITIAGVLFLTLGATGSVLAQSEEAPKKPFLDRVSDEYVKIPKNSEKCKQFHKNSWGTACLRAHSNNREAEVFEGSWKEANVGLIFSDEFEKGNPYIELKGGVLDMTFGGEGDVFLMVDGSLRCEKAPSAPYQVGVTVQSEMFMGGKIKGVPLGVTAPFAFFPVNASSAKKCVFGENTSVYGIGLPFKGYDGNNMWFVMPLFTSRLETLDEKGMPKYGLGFGVTAKMVVGDTFRTQISYLRESLEDNMGETNRLEIGGVISDIDLLGGAGIIDVSLEHLDFKNIRKGARVGGFFEDDTRIKIGIGFRR